MEAYRDNEIAMWVCRHGSSADVVEFPLDERRPIDQACASHGEELIRRCPNEKCPASTYHPSDLERRYHHCGEKIPWAESRAEMAKAMMEHDSFNSKIVGRPKPQRGLLERGIVVRTRTCTRSCTCDMSRRGWASGTRGRFTVCS
jgi:hypothetical protein